MTLSADEVSRQIEALDQRQVLDISLLANLRAIARILRPDGLFLLRDAIAVAGLVAGDEADAPVFERFREQVNQAAARAKIGLTLETNAEDTGREGSRQGWFTDGDLVTTGISLFTEEAAAQTVVAHPVAPSVAELGPPSAIRVYISFQSTMARSVARDPRQLVWRLREHLAAGQDHMWEITHTHDTAIGQNSREVRDEFCTRADIRVALVTPGYIAAQTQRPAPAPAADTGADDWKRVQNCPGPLVAFAFSALPDQTPLRLGRLGIHEIRRRRSPWDQLSSEKQRVDYITELADALRVAVQSPPKISSNEKADKNTEQPSDESLTQWTTATARLHGIAKVIPGEAAETTLHGSVLNDRDRAAGPALPAVQRLVEWSSNSDTQPLCALLGDVGMGKTTTLKMFAQRLLELRGGGVACPLPILFDLRDVRIKDLSHGLTVDHILDSMLAADRPVHISPGQLTAHTVRQRIARGDTVVIFDGLDEVLVHLSPHDRQLFTRQLWRAVDQRSGSKLLVSCRTQYFRTIREETTYFLGEDRQGLRGEHYLALLMLPFGEEQVRAYLKANLGQDDAAVDNFLQIIAGVHNLTELSRRPMTLTMIADQVDFIETAKAQGNELRAVDLYREFVDRWLSRDTGKHTLLPQHKQLLMEHLAAALWTSGQTAWDPDRIEAWLLDLLDTRSDLQRHYRQPLPDLWTADLRTATFLSREGDTFSFSHRSLFEYFLANYLCRALTRPQHQTDKPLQAWAMPVPSPETLDFLGQLISGLPNNDRTAAVVVLRSTANAYHPQISELALTYSLHAIRNNYPHHSITGIDLTGANLTAHCFGDERVAGREPNKILLNMTGARLTHADLRQVRFDHVDLTGADLTGADLTNAEFHHCRLNSIQLMNARMGATIIRGSQINAVDFTVARTNRTQLLHCTPTPAPNPRLLIAPRSTSGLPPRNPHQLRRFANPRGQSSVAYSPNGTHILTGSYRGGAHIWDATTGEQLHHIDTASALSVTYSPDGTHILTAGYLGAHIWDATTGEQLHHIDTTSDIRAVTYSPDGTHILTASYTDGTHIWNATTGEQLHHIDTTSDIQAITYSPDGTHILTASFLGVQIWSAATRQRVGLTIDLFGANDYVVADAISGEVINASDNAWRWLGWSIIEDGHFSRLPAETYGPLLRTNTDQ